MKLPLYQVDAFTDQLFRGNPAAVVLLENWLEDTELQAIARENNLSETAFVRREGDAYRIRWFTPTVEVALCGHATLAAAHTLFQHGGVQTDAVRFASQSGELTVARDGDLFVLDFPSDPPHQLALEDTQNAALAEALGAPPTEMWEGRYHLAVYPNADAVTALTPDFAALARIPHYAIVATAPGEESDFVSRFFGPRVGVPEDPVTGSAHCMLVPFWAERLGNPLLHARQLSDRGGELFCEQVENRVRIAGRAVEYLAGEIQIP